LTGWLLGDPGVQRHPHLYPVDLAQLLGAEGSLDCQGRLDGSSGGRERRAAGVTDGLEDVASAFLYDALQDLVVAFDSELHL
jgi:hypothetical protein